MDASRAFLSWLLFFFNYFLLVVSLLGLYYLYCYNCTVVPAVSLGCCSLCMQLTWICRVFVSFVFVRAINTKSKRAYDILKINRVSEKSLRLSCNLFILPRASISFAHGVKKVRLTTTKAFSSAVPIVRFIFK